MDAAMSRTAARSVKCPACAAEPDERCRGVRGKPREANHRERVDAAEAAAQGERDRRWADYDVGIIGATTAP